MKVVFVSDHFSSPHQPGILRTWQVARHLAEAGDQVTVVAPSSHYLFGTDATGGVGEEAGLPHGVTLVPMRLAPLRRGSLASRLRYYAGQLVTSTVATWRCGRCDVVVAGLTPSMLAIGCFAAARLRGVPFVLDERDMSLDAAEQARLLPPLALRAARVVERFLYARSDGIITVTPGLRGLLEGRGIPAGKITLAPNGYDPPPDDWAGPGRDVLRERLGWSGRTVVLYAGGLGPMYDLDTVLDAAAMLDRDAFLFAIMGEGESKPHLIARARRERLPVLFPEPVAKAAVVSVCQAADICVVPLRGLERNAMVLSNKLFDYLGAGRPAVVTEPGDMADVVTEAGAGLAVSPGDAAALAAALATLAADPAARARMGEVGRAIATGRWSRAAALRDFRSALLRAAGQDADHRAEDTGAVEHQRVRQVYLHYDTSPAQRRKRDGGNAGNRLTAQARWAAIIAEIREVDLPAGARVLDVGCGDGADLARLRTELADCRLELHGVDLLVDRLERARQAVPGAALSVGGAERLPYRDGVFDLVFVSTLFSSVLDDALAARMAKEIARVTAPGGTILWYDVRLPNPWNRNTRSRSASTVRALFRGAAVTLTPVTVLPPLARWLGAVRPGPLRAACYRGLHAVRPARSHYLATIRPARHASRQKADAAMGRFRVLVIAPGECRFDHMAVNERIRALARIGPVEVRASYPDAFPADIAELADVRGWRLPVRCGTSPLRLLAFTATAACWAVGRRLRGHRYRLVYTIQDASALAGWLLRRPGTGWVIDVLDDPGLEVSNARRQGRWSRAAAHAVRRRLIGWLLPRADLVATIGSGAGDPLPALLRARYRVPPARIVPVRQGIDVASLAGALAEPPPRRPLTIFYVGWVSELRGAGTLVAAVDLLRQRGLAAELRMAGYRKPGDRELHLAIAGRPYVSYLGVLPSDEVATEILAAQVCCCPFPNREELACVQPVKVLEYLSLGRPVVATSLPGIAAVIEDGVTGLLVRPGSAADLADALERVLTDQALADGLAAKARDAAAEFDIDRVTGDLLARVTACASVS